MRQRTTRRWFATSTSWTAISPAAELCHPSDNMGAVLAACEHAGGSGKDFLTTLAVAYQVEAALTAAAPFMAHGFDLTTQLTYSLGAGLSKALGLDEKTGGVGRRDLRRHRHPAACRADHSDLAMEGPGAITAGPRVRQRDVPGVPRRDRSYSM